MQEVTALDITGTHVSGADKIGRRDMPQIVLLRVHYQGRLKEKAKVRFHCIPCR